MIELAKNHIDVGLFTQQLDAGLAFWSDQAGCVYDHCLAVGGGVRQHRHVMNGSILKMNHVRDPLPEQHSSGYARLEIAAAVGARQRLYDPDGNLVELVPRGGAIAGIRVTVAGSSRERFDQFYGDVLQLRAAGGDWQCGDSLIGFEERAELAADEVARRAGTDMRGVGFRYLTIQVLDVEGVHRSIVERGGIQGREPVTLGDVARISFVRDLDGNWIEISQRRSLTGSLA